MINRVLIRIKVVQLLYSYLLTEKLFTLESQPTPPTKEKRFAYQLYIDMLTLMTRIASEVQQRGGHKPLADNRFIRTLLADEKIKTQLAKDRLNPTPLSSEALVSRISEAVKETAFYKDYAKSESLDMAHDLKVWRDIFNIILKPDAGLARIYAELPNYSPRGVERMQELMVTTFANFSSSQGHVSDASKTLDFSLRKANELYHLILLLIVDLTRLREQNLDSRRHKYVVTEEDLNPDMRFVDNKLALRIAEDPQFQAYAEKNKLSWFTHDAATLDYLLKKVLDSDFYKKYMEAPEASFHDDCLLWKNLLRYVILPDEELQDTLESKSVFWNDDLDSIGTFVLKTLRRYEDGEPEPLLPMYKDDEDARFGKELFNAVIKGKETATEIIEQALNKDSWESDRLAFMDVVILRTALAELLNFPKIPVSVTVNEYIEIAKAYSTPKSSYFINGLLGAAVANLREQGKLLKP
ncbi:MAG: transcription antitermination protein NusB [Prevotella sp.]|nr:transcription antitermination protein NusB [Prevotella sp.]MCM1074198.1 transcription antitermination protein NusB [Ruminococcus sp.]